MSALGKIRGKSQEANSELSVSLSTASDPLQVWAGTIGKAFEAVTDWRAAFFASTAVNVALVGLLWWQAQKGPEIRTVAVVLDPSAKIEDVIEAVGFVPSERHIAQVLGEDMDALRSVSPDRTLLAKNWRKVLARSTPQAKAMIDAQTKEDPWGYPDTVPETKARVVDDMRVQVVSVESYTLTWRERDYEQGRLVMERRMSGSITISRKPAVDVEAVKQNPLGIWIDAIRWQRT